LGGGGHSARKRAGIKTPGVGGKGMGTRLMVDKETKKKIKNQCIKKDRGPRTTGENNEKRHTSGGKKGHIITYIQGYLLNTFKIGMEARSINQQVY